MMEGRGCYVQKMCWGLLLQDEEGVSGKDALYGRGVSRQRVKEGFVVWDLKGVVSVQQCSWMSAFPQEPGSALQCQLLVLLLSELFWLIGSPARNAAVVLLLWHTSHICFPGTATTTSPRMASVAREAMQTTAPRWVCRAWTG